MRAGKLVVVALVALAAAAGWSSRMIEEEEVEH